jgi:benzoyl-CoA 2,3-dioxygenase component A
MPKASAYSLEEQLGWDELPEVLHDAVDASAPPTATVQQEATASFVAADPVQAQAFASSSYGSTLPPWSAAHPYVNLHGPKSPITAKVVGNVQVNDAGTDNETHHIVIDFGAMPFPVLEGQSIGVVPPGVDAQGKAHHARQYSIASPRNGERAGYNNVSLTVKRVVEDHQGKAVKGVASNFLCDLKIGDEV